VDYQAMAHPPTEQLIRDYLNRVSVAARGRLAAEDRREFLAHTREFIEQNTRALGRTDSADVLRLLAGLGDPGALVERERERLVALRAESGESESSGGLRVNKVWRHRPQRGSLTGLLAAKAAPIAPGDVVPLPEHADDAPLTGELRFPTTRPINARWRPGATVDPKPPRSLLPALPRRIRPAKAQRPAAASADAGAAGTGQQTGTGQQSGGLDQQPAASTPPLPADNRHHRHRPEWPWMAAKGSVTPGAVSANGVGHGDADSHVNGVSGASSLAGANGATTSAAPSAVPQAGGAQPGGGVSGPPWEPAEPTGEQQDDAFLSGLVPSGGALGGAAGGAVAGSGGSGETPPASPLARLIGTWSRLRQTARQRGTAVKSGWARSGGAWSHGVRSGWKQAGGTAGQLGDPGAGAAGSQPRVAGRASRSLGSVSTAGGRLARSLGAAAWRHPLEATAVVLLGLGGLIFPPVWLLGAAVALVSKVWDFRDKWIGLAIPIFLVIAGMGADITLGGSHATLLAYFREAWLFGGRLSRLAAVLGAAYLTWRATHERRPPAVPPWNKPHRIG
jgi:hypothetical protein